MSKENQVTIAKWLARWLATRQVQVSNPGKGESIFRWIYHGYLPFHHWKTNEHNTENFTDILNNSYFLFYWTYLDDK